MNPRMKPENQLVTFYWICLFFERKTILTKGLSCPTDVSISMRAFLKRDDEARVLIEPTLRRGTRFKPTLCSLDLRRSRAL